MFRLNKTVDFSYQVLVLNVCQALKKSQTAIQSKSLFLLEKETQKDLHRSTGPLHEAM